MHRDFKAVALASVNMSDRKLCSPFGWANNLGSSEGLPWDRKYNFHGRPSRIDKIWLQIRGLDVYDLVTCRI